jgi:hypothetical protein
MWICNIGGGLVGTIWLIINGHWAYVLTCIIIAAFMPWMLGILNIIPTMISIGASKISFSLIRYILFFIGNLLSYLISYAWAFSVLCTIYRNTSLLENLLPCVLFSFSIIMIPFFYIARKEGDSIASAIHTMTILFSVFVWELFILFSSSNDAFTLGFLFSSVILLVGIVSHTISNEYVYQNIL